MEAIPPDWDMDENRGTTRLAVLDRPVRIVFEKRKEEAAHDRIASALI